MNNALRLAALLLAFVAVSPRAEAGYGRMPYYSAWASRGNYQYRMYNYYSPGYQSYRKHVAIYYPSRPRYVYYYNPYKRKYWGRYDLQSGGYSTLAVQDRKENLADISESDFPPAGPMPTPEDGEDALLPPVENLPPQAPAPAPAPARGPSMSPPPYMAPGRSAPSCHAY